MPSPARTRVGAHVGRIDEIDLVAEARSRGADCVQIFVSDPQDWKATPLDGVDAEAVRRAAAEADIAVYVHAPYVINVATTNNRIRIPSRKLLQQVVTAAGAIGAAGVIVHGGHVTSGADAAAGFANWAKALDRLEPGAPVLIENTAGGNGAMARTVEQLERLWAAVGHTDVGLCLDTCHAFSAGIELAEVVERFRAVTGRVDLVHANDSRDPFGSARDRHADLGEGEIGAEPVAAVVAAAGCDAVLETPGVKAGHAQDIAWLREQLTR
ncbi:MAG TPA: deoxyribonuclease IV [Actinomycetes bacterium]|nr:deoxyribonuclease IV [Actinomycetes bacterium]